MRFLEDVQGVTAYFSEKKDGPMGGAASRWVGGVFAENRRRFLEERALDPAKFRMAALVHGTKIDFVTESGATRRLETDALFTQTKGVPIGFTVRDCPAVFIAGPGVLAVVHAGWRGMLSGIVPKTMLRLGVHLSQLKVVVSPAIQQCCYEIRNDENGLSNYEKAGYSEFVRKTKDGRYFASLSRMLLGQITDHRFFGLHLKAEQVEVSFECTACSSIGFFSYRRDGNWTNGETNLVVAALV